MTSLRPTSTFFPVLWALFLAAGMVALRLMGTSAWDLGDGALHYLQVRYAPQNVQNFFDRWAKPLYVLLGTPFAQLGPIGMVVFNALVAWLTARGVLSFLGPVSRIIAWMVPVLLFSSIQYFRVVVSGLTEPLFGLLTMACLLLLWRERHSAAMIVLSLAPLARPEYMAFAPYVIAWVLYAGKWKALPWALSGTVVYLVAGGLVLNERIWHFARDPYEGGADFGKGPLDHFLTHAPEVLGGPLLVLGCLAIPTLVLLLWGDSAQRRQHLFVLVLAVFPVLSIWGIHSYAYWAGGHASGGLLRVLATATPLTVVLVGYVLVCLRKRWNSRWTVHVGVLLGVAISVWAWTDLQRTLGLPAQATVQQQLVERAAAVALERLDPGEKIYSAHPYFAVAAGLDIGDTSLNGRSWEVDLDRLRPGDMVQWDPLYGPEGTRQLLQRLIDHEHYAVVSMDTESQGPWQPPFGMWLWERTDEPQRSRVDTIIDTKRGIGTDLLIAKPDVTSLDRPSLAFRINDTEYPLDIQGMAGCRTGEVLNEWVVSAHVEPIDGVNEVQASWVFESQDPKLPMVTLEGRIGTGRSEIRFHQGGRLSAKVMRMFLWNIDRHSFILHDLRVTRRCIHRVDQPHTQAR